jgi:transposase-like protein
MAQPSNERRFRFFLNPPPPCPLCESRHVTCVGHAEDVGFFRCTDCDAVFTIQLTAPASEVAHDAHIET